MQDSNKIQAYETFLSDFGFQIAAPNRDITQQAAKLRAKYPALKGMDSIHLATSMYYNCGIFLTNDTQLRQITEANVVLVDDL